MSELGPNVSPELLYGTYTQLYHALEVAEHTLPDIDDAPTDFAELDDMITDSDISPGDKERLFGALLKAKNNTMHVRLEIQAMNIAIARHALLNHDVAAYFTFIEQRDVWHQDALKIRAPRSTD